MKTLRLLPAILLMSVSMAVHAGSFPVKIKKEVKKGRLQISSQSRHDLGLTISLFDVQGKLVRQVLVRTNQTSSFAEISKGEYFFEIFNNDKRIDHGSITVP